MSVFEFIVSLFIPLLPFFCQCSDWGFCHSRNASCEIVKTLGYEPQCVLNALASCEEMNMMGHFEHELRNIAHSIEEYVIAHSKSLQRPRNCQELQHTDGQSGVKTVYPYMDSPNWGVAVFCEQQLDGGGWTVIQRRDATVGAREDFYRIWIEYQLGFGNLSGEFWLGLDNIHALTSSKLMQLKVDLQDFEGESQYDKFSVFRIGDSASKYILEISGHSGTAGNSFYATQNEHYIQNGMKFTTMDQDNDSHSTENCAKLFKGGWWYNACGKANLNGFPFKGHHESRDGIKYNTFKGSSYSLKYVSMMIKPTYEYNKGNLDDHDLFFPRYL